MTTSTSGEWTVDVEAMTCRNIKKDILVVFKWDGEILTGKIMEMPILLMKWTKLPNVHMFVERIIMEAQEVFMQVYTKNSVGTNAE